ncbi:MAG: ABC transporter ATP-binding protein [Alphaproteobacteria bacterium]
MIEIEHLIKRFGPIAAVDGVSFRVAKGEVLGFLGPNGAGKSTTMKMITGYLKPTSGRVRVMGEDALAHPIAAQRAIGYLPEGAPAYGDMTPRQFLHFCADARNVPPAGRAASIERSVEMTELEGVLDQPIETLSKGFKRRVGLAQAILSDPPCLVMDEPTDGLDPNQKHSVRQLIAKMAKDKAIILSTHILEEVDAVCTRALIINRGRIVADGTPGELMARSRYYNAVTVVIGVEKAETARQIFRLQTSILGHEERAQEKGRIAFTLLPRPGRSIIEGLLITLRERNIEAHEYVIEQGRLDEVFRTLTAETETEIVARGDAA